MGRWTPVPVAGGSYSDDAKPWTVQDAVNYLPVAAEREGTRSPAILRQRPGYTVFANTNGSPIRGMHDAEGLRLVVAGTSLYSIHPTTGAAASLGTIPGVGRVSMAHNQIAGGVEVVIANGSSAYVWNTVTATLAQITDEGFPGAKVVDFCDGYIMFVEPFGRYWGHSDLADATSYNTLDRSEAEAQPDRIVTGIVSHRQWIVFGERSTEFYANTGGATGTFQRINGTEAEIGAAGTHTVSRLDNSVFVVGHDGVGYRVGQNGGGYGFVRITTHAIEQAWSRCNLADAYCFTFEDHGHKVWYVSMTDGRTWGYDVATGEWHRCKSYGLDFWRMSHLVRWGGRWYGGDYTNGQIYLLDWRVNNDAGEPLERERTFAVMHDSGNRVFLDAILLEFDTGKTEDSPPLPTPVLSELSISGDLPDGDQGEVVSYEYTVSGGIRPYASASVSVGALPDGLSLDTSDIATGTIRVTGTRTTPGTYPFTLLATDADGSTATLDDTSTTHSLAITAWSVVPDEMAQTHISTHVADGIIAIGGNNCSLTYTTDEGADWTVLAGTTAMALGNAGAPVSGIVKFEGDWYAFQAEGYMSRAIGDSFSFAAVANAPSASRRSPAVLGGSLYCGVNGNDGGANILLKKMVTAGAVWTTIDTGIVAGSGSDEINNGCETDAGYVFATGDGHALFSADLVTFSKVLTNVDATQAAAIGDTVIVTTSGGGYYKSTDGGQTFAALVVTPGLRVVGSNAQMFIAGAVQNAYTSLDGDTWTLRLDTTFEPGTNNTLAACDGSVAVICRATSYAIVGTSP